MKSRRKKMGKRAFSALLTAVMAVTLLAGIPTGELSKAEAAVLSNPRRDSSGVVTYDCVYFGNYWQEDTNGDGQADKQDAKMPIKWRVLSVDGNDAFLIADKNLDIQRYNTSYTSVTWETCTMRSWLNGYDSSRNAYGTDYSGNGASFISNAFTASEQNAIINTTLENADNSYYGTNGGNATTDKVFLLSEKDIANPAYGFSNYELINGNIVGTIVGTIGNYSIYDYAKLRYNTGFAKGSDTASGNSGTSDIGTGWWWLRSPGYNSDNALNVNDYGYVFQFGHYVGSHNDAVCPALHLNLSSSNLWSYAGTVSSDGKGTEGENSPAEGEEPTGGTGGLSCKQSLNIEVGQTESINAQVYGESELAMKSLSSGTQWSSSDPSVVTVSNAGFIQSISPSTYVSPEGSYSLWWASGLVYVKGIKKGTATVTGTLSDGTSMTCQVTVEETPDSNRSEGSGGSLTIGDNAAGKADSGSGVAQFFPASWSLKSSKYPVELGQTENEDGTYTIKASIGIGRSNLLDKDTEWCKYKSACETANKNCSDYDVLASYREMFGLKTSTAISSTGWKGSKPSMSVMGYVENQYDKYGNLIKASGCIAGNLEFKGGMSWQFATPIGPMFLKFEAGGKLTLSGGPSWDNKNSQMSLNGKATITPSVSLAGGYGIDKVASISAKGKLSLGVQAYPPSKGNLTAEASVNAQVLFVFDKTWTLAKYSQPLWDNTGSNKSKKADINSISKADLQLMSTDFAEDESVWSGNLKLLTETQKKVLQDGVLGSTLPMLAEADGKQVLVWQAYDEERETANSTVLKYSVYEGGRWSEPKAVLDDGYGDAYADLQVIDGKIYLTWQKHMKKITTTDEETAIDQMAENSEIFCAEFNLEDSSFTNITQITDNEQCDMMPQFVKGTSSVEIAFVRNDAGSILQSEGVNAIYSVKLDDVDNENKLIESPGTIDRFTAYVHEDATKAMYVTQTNDIAAVMNSDSQPIDEFNELMRLSEEGTITSLNYDEGCISAICDGVLHIYDLAGGEMEDDTAGSSAFDANAVFCRNGLKSGYVWSSYDEDTDTGYIKASMKTDDGYSEPVVIYETEGEITRYMSPVLTQDGGWNIALNQENTDDGIHSLCYLQKEESTDSSLVFADINENEKDGSKTGVDYVFVNNGDTYIDTIALTITADDGTAVNKEVDVHVAPGEIVSDTAYVDISSIENGQDIRISMCDVSETVSDDDIVDTEYARTDIALVGTATEDDNGIQVWVTAKNQGENQADVNVSIYSDSDMGSKLSEDTAVKIESGKEKEIGFTVDKDSIIYNENDAAYLTVNAEVTGGDYDTSNNVVYLALYKGEEVNANTAEKGTSTEPEPGEDTTEKDNTEESTNPPEITTEEPTNPPATTEKPTNPPAATEKPVNSKVPTAETSTIPAPAKVGTSFKAGKANYKVTSAGASNPNVTYMRPAGKTVKTASVPATVEYDGITYKVTAVSANAFKGNTKLAKVTIGANVTSIGKNAFNGCKKLKTITIKSSKLKTVGSNAIKGIHVKAAIKVPKKQLSSYRKLFKPKTGFKKTMKVKK